LQRSCGAIISTNEFISYITNPEFDFDFQMLANVSAHFSVFIFLDPVMELYLKIWYTFPRHCIALCQIIFSALSHMSDPEKMSPTSPNFGSIIAHLLAHVSMIPKIERTGSMEGPDGRGG
jgi:hypothetical protein